MSEPTLLTQIRERRDQADARWNLTARDLLAAYNAGERDFRRANLSHVSLSGANLSRVSLSGAILSGATLDGATLYDAALSGANLSYANLSHANLSRTNLDGANLDGANLDGASLSHAILDGANLSHATLSDQQLRQVTLAARADFYAKCFVRPKEIAGLRLALVEGRVDGSTYEGECACFVGTLANVAGCDYRRLEGITPDANSPIERLFLAIHKGDTPENNPVSRLVVEWIDDLMRFVVKAQP